MSRFDEKPEAPRSPLNSFFSSDRKVGKGLATYGGLDHGILDQHATIEDVDGDANAVTEVASDEDTLYAVGRSHWGVDNPNLADEVATSAAVMDRVSVSEVAMDAVSASDVAMDAVIASNDIALPKVVNTQVAMDAVSASTVAMDAVAASALAMDAVIASTDIALPTVVESATAMDSVSTSQTAMDAVSTSQTAMDAVSTSDTALDSIWDSALAWDTVKTKAMAVGKFVAGRAGLDGANFADIDAVTADQAAMDAVAGSQLAMDAVAGSILAYTAAFESDYSIDSLWASTPGAKTILESSGDKALPVTESVGSGDATYSVDDGIASALPGNTAHQLHIFVDGASSDNYASITYPVDLSDADTLEIKTKAEGGPDNSQFKHGVKIDGDQVFQTGGENGYTTRSLDISSYAGTLDIELYHDNTGYNNTDPSNDYDFYFADINLI